MAERIKRTGEEIAGVLSIFGSIYIVLSLVTHSVNDPVLFFRITEPPLPVRNLGGIIGANLSGWLFISIGIAAFLSPLMLLVFGIRRLIGKDKQRVYFFGGIMLIISSALFMALLAYTFSIPSIKYPDGIGGLAGREIAGMLIHFLSIPGAYIFALSAFLSSLILISPVSITAIAFSRKKISEDALPVREEIPVAEEQLLPGEQDILIGSIETMPVEQTDFLVQDDLSETAQHMPVVPVPRTKDGYEIPSLELLNTYEIPSSRPSKDDFLAESSVIEKKLEDFDVKGRISHVHPGPVITMYEFEPAPGVKITRVVSLAEDLALALKAQSIRISPVPGKATIGIEVPNRQREMVSLREILSSDNFKKSSSKLILCLGKDIFGNAVMADLSKMPHLLVAGATGSGKSVSINSMVMSILFKATPSDVRMLMIDPKLIELSTYEGIPHLISPVITGPKAAAEALKKMVFEMERRYRLLAEKSARNIESFNNRIFSGRDSGDDEEEQLPYIIVFIDELADLMFTSANDVEDSITRLAQMGRASGIHLILATQRPSVDVITGIIKANFPARIAFQVSSKIDSRTILDGGGAEQLLGQGDMLLMLPGARIIRVHGALITEGEIKRVVDFIRPQGKPDFTMFENIETEGMVINDVSEERDEMYLKAIEFAETVREVSISSIQRRFKIGYNRAARIMELMEEDGLVGPQRAAGKPRDFLGRKRNQ
jgi:S-DNA-T family DNA segregation ATPase FtsK/SpoIIIE